MKSDAMDPQVGLRFRVQQEDKSQVIVVDAERALVGSATHCELRLAAEVVAYEHLEVFVHEGAVHFATKPYVQANFPVLENGSTEGRWPAGMALRIGAVSLHVDLVDLGASKAKFPLWALLAAVPVVLLLVMAITLTRNAHAGEPIVPAAPALFGPKTARCPDVAPEQRAPLAVEKSRIAAAKRERSPFAPADGLEAVSLFELSAACFRTAGAPDRAKEADDAANDLRSRIDEEYRLRRVRLEHAYRTHQPAAAKRELVILIPLTAQHRGAYTDWLAAIDRAYAAELDSRGRIAP